MGKSKQSLPIWKARLTREDAYCITALLSGEGLQKERVGKRSNIRKKSLEEDRRCRACTSDGGREHSKDVLLLEVRKETTVGSGGRRKLPAKSDRGGRKENLFRKLTAVRQYISGLVISVMLDNCRKGGRNS